MVDMAVLGATLGALLLVCLVVIGVLVHRMQRGKADWRKIYEANVFRSSVSSKNILKLARVMKINSDSS